MTFKPTLDKFYFVIETCHGGSFSTARCFMNQFTCGDVVVLRSENITMTVKSQDANFVHCEWQSSEGIMQKHTFQSKMLELYDPGVGFVMLG